MNLIRKSLISGLVGTILISLMSCNPVNRSVTTQTEPTTAPLNSPTPQASSPQPTPSQSTITLYKPDQQCQTLIPSPVSVSQQQPLEGAVSKILEASNSPDFEIAGYRIQQDQATQTTTIDLRVSPNSQRQIASLSSCEQLALFGSLRKTLTENPQWQIQEVRFTERGQEIIL